MKNFVKPIFVIFLVTFWLGAALHAQIVIDQSDMPSPGDTLRVSVSNVVPAGFSKTAMDTSWNFAALEALSQRVDTFVSATSTPSGYQLFFVLLGGANLASPRNGNLIPGLPLSQGFSFYKNSAASFSDLGSAYTIQGLPFPAKYNNPDKFYEFPLLPGKTWSSDAYFSIAVPGLASYTTERVRSNLVDGWGTLTTPFGTYETVRVKSNLMIHDSVYIDSLKIGFPIIRNITEYKWLAKGQGIPLLQISEEGALVTAIYRDIFRFPANQLSVSLGPDTAVLKGTTITLRAVINNGTPPYQVFWSTMETSDSINITVQNTRTYSVIVIDALQNIGTAQKLVSVKYAPGVEEHKEKMVKVYPNPARGPVRIGMPGDCTNAVIQVLTPQGKTEREFLVSPTNGKFDADLSGLPCGIHFIRVITESEVYSGKVEIIK